MSAKSSQKTHVKLLESKQDSKLHAKVSQIKPSFDCTKAKGKVEKMICNDESRELQRLDSNMNEAFRIVIEKYDLAFIYGY